MGTKGVDGDGGRGKKGTSSPAPKWGWKIVGNFITARGREGGKKWEDSKGRRHLQFGDVK